MFDYLAFLVYLATELKIPKEFYSLLQGLTPEFVMTRYPDVAGEAPYKLYGLEKTETYLKESRRFLQWLEHQMNKQ